MLNSDELLAIGAALVQTVRTIIRYSDNMDESGQLFDGLKQSHVYEELTSKYPIWRSNPYTPDGVGKKSLELGAGFCDSLSLACLYIAKGLEEIRIGTFYLSIMSTPTHVFVLAHTSLDLFKSSSGSSKMWRYYKKDFEALSNSVGFENAVIIDPWIYKATKLENYLEHLEHARLYQVQDFYDSDIRYLDSVVHLKISPTTTVSQIHKKYIDIFTESYKSQKQKLDNKRDTFARGRRFSSVRESLVRNIERGIQQAQITSLTDFFIRLANQSSSWYSGYKHSDRKGKCIRSVITYLDTLINDINYPGDAKLIEIFQRVLTILPIVRKSNNIPNNLSLENIAMTKTAKGLFDSVVTPDRPLAFEAIDSLNLDWIRRAHRGSDRVKYKVLFREIIKWNASKNVDALFLQKFYTNKDGYYELVNLAIQG
ncbi:hypothetical protein IB643_07130 [Allofrancisella guangzhouensis]|uniref:hypothetical protein n=1 Tax=Allofrancisella guangzhouensis TaxID=594679 RepID=UPI00190825FA|nr:hypothetical protein [Allofrancisella guangzhouensis]MBK2027922.1 hypothetical protein [Allofrancisella guangzhouensis]